MLLFAAGNHSQSPQSHDVDPSGKVLSARRRRRDVRVRQDFSHFNKSMCQSYKTMKIENLISCNNLDSSVIRKSFIYFTNKLLYSKIEEKTFLGLFPCVRQGFSTWCHSICGPLLSLMNL